VHYRLPIGDALDALCPGRPNCSLKAAADSAQIHLGNGMISTGAAMPLQAIHFGDSV
jgi:hypothetical protein